MSTSRSLSLGVLLVGTAAFTVSAFEAVSLADYSGEEIFATFCASCHGVEGRGDGPVAATLRVPVANLTQITERYGEFPAARIAESIDGRGVVITAHGPRSMPVWGYEFWVEEGADIVAQSAVRDAIAKLVDHVRALDTPSARDD